MTHWEEMGELRVALNGYVAHCKELDDIILLLKQKNKSLEQQNAALRETNNLLVAQLEATRAVAPA